MTDLESLSIADAKMLYNTWTANMGGVPKAFEHLSERERAAWREIALLAADGDFVRRNQNPECPICRDDLICTTCDPGTCAACGTGMVCPDCNAILCPDCREPMQCAGCSPVPLPFCVGESR